MPPDMAIDMRRTKLKREEAALLAGELKKPSWQSRNEGIHERVSFEDSIWGFDLAGGAFYKTPLRVVAVKPDSRAEKAGIRPGDKLKRINDIETEKLTIQEAHTIIIESGVHLRIAVSAPEDEEDSYFCYQDPLESGYDSEEERRKEEENARKREVHAKVSSYWSLKWPWVSKRRVIYRESNCFMVPSKYEGKHQDMFLEQPSVRVQDDIVLQSAKTDKENLEKETKQTDKANGTIQNGEKPKFNGDRNISKMVNGDKVTHNGDFSPIPEEDNENSHEISNNSDVSVISEDDKDTIQEIANDNVLSESPLMDINQEVSNSQNGEVEEDINSQNKLEEDSVQEDTLDSLQDNSVEVEDSQELYSKDDQIINEVLNNEVSEIEDEVIDAILSGDDTVESER